MKKNRNSFFADSNINYQGFNPNNFNPYQNFNANASMSSGFMPNINPNEINERFAKIERQINRLEHRINILESNDNTQSNMENINDNMYML